MFTYLLQASVCLVVFYTLYYMLMSELRFFQWNRVYLMSALIFSVFIPWFAPNFTIPESQIAGMHWVNIMEEVELTRGQTQGVDMTRTPDLFSALTWVYITGVIFVFARFLYGLFKIFSYYKKGQIIPRGDYTIVETGKRHLPFSFFFCIFIDRFQDDNDVRTMIEHEKVHISQKHSLDLLLTECFFIIFWFHPLVLWYKRAIRQVHECLADESVCRVINKRQYIAALLRKPEEYFEAGLGHTFYQSQIKQRLHMMTKIKNHEKARWVYLITVPVMAGLFLLFSTPLSGKIIISDTGYPVVHDTVPTPPKPPVPPKAPAPPSGSRKQKEAVNVVPPPPPPPPPSYHAQKSQIEEMPRYLHAECESLPTREAKEKCANSKLIQHVADYLVYPEAARKDSIEGMVVVQFLVKEDGSMGDIKVVRDIGYGCGEAVIQVLQPMTGQKNKFLPGKDKGKNVSVMQTLPVRFKLH